MKKVESEALITRLNEFYALHQEGEKEGIEMLKKAWFYDEKDKAFYLRIVNGNKPLTILHRVGIQ